MKILACQPRFSESKGGYSQLWNKILYLTRDESRFYPRVITALTKRFFARVRLLSLGQ